jgi:hypothetical protein
VDSLNKLAPPTHDNATAIIAIANNTKMKSYPALLPWLPKILLAYSQYELEKGNPFRFSTASLGQIVADHLRAHYKGCKNIKAVHYISAYRSAMEHSVCPMCGSMHRGTLDHLFPQATYPELALLSLNLVPACKCNLKRQDSLVGPNPGERILNPYFDHCLGDRLIEARFVDLGAVPRVSLQIVADPLHPDYPAISFHVRTIVNRTAIRAYLADRWTHLYRKPQLVVRKLDKTVKTIAALEALLEIERTLLDDLHGGKNNWNSIFIGGLLEPSVLSWLLVRLAGTEIKENG